MTSEAETARFRDYVTSGAFSLSLSASQIAALSVVAETGETGCGGHTIGAMFRKGLVTHIRSNDGKLEYRLTEAGVFALKLARLAGLSQGQPDPVAQELGALRQQLDQARTLAQQLAADCWDMSARVQKAQQAVAEARAWAEGATAPRRPMVTLKDRHPERTQAEIMGHLQAAENFLQVTDQMPGGKDA